MFTFPSFTTFFKISKDAFISCENTSHGSATTSTAYGRPDARNTGSAQQDAPGRPASQRIGKRPDLRTAITRLMTPSGDGEVPAREDLLAEHALEQRVAQLELEVAELRALSGAEAST
jgi:hypothetical protein